MSQTTPARGWTGHGHTPPVESRCFPSKFSFRAVRHPQDVVEFSVTDASPFVRAFLWSFPQNKKPCLLGVSRVEKSSSFLYLLTSGLSKPASGRCPRYDLDSPRLNARPRLNRL